MRNWKQLRLILKLGKKQTTIKDEFKMMEAETDEIEK
jgi:hypothetical protein